MVKKIRTFSHFIVEIDSDEYELFQYANYIYTEDGLHSKNMEHRLYHKATSDEVTDPELINLAIMKCEVIEEKEEDMGTAPAISV